MSLMAWNESYSVGVKSIDQQHVGLFNIINELHTAMMERKAQTVTGSLLDKLVKYTREHFADEERKMEAAKFPGLSGHHAIHVELVRQVEEFITRHKAGDTSVNIDLLGFLSSSWLTGHIQKVDKQYRPSMIEHGVK